MRTHEFCLLDGRKVYGYLSKVDADTETAYVLTEDTLGVAGKDGVPIRFADCQAIYAETGRPGIYDSEEQMAVWRRSWRKG